MRLWLCIAFGRQHCGKAPYMAGVKACIHATDCTYCLLHSAGSPARNIDSGISPATSIGL